MEFEKAFYDLANLFKNRMQSLHIVNKETQDVDLSAIEYAKNYVKAFPIDLGESFSDDFDFLLGKIFLEHQNKDVIDAKELLKAYQADDVFELNANETDFRVKKGEKATFIKWANENKLDFKKLWSYSRKNRISAPMNGDIIRQGALVYLVSYFELLLGDLFRIFYQIYPNKITQGKTLKYEDILELGTIDAIQSKVIEDEVSGILGDSLSYKNISGVLKRTSGVDISEVNPLFPVLVEMFERRNVFVHNSGRVDDRYLNKVPKEYLKSINARNNLALVVQKNYLQKSIDTCLIAGTIILQRCWRKWLSTEIRLADQFLTELIFEKLIEDRYELVHELIDFAVSVKMASYSSRFSILINNAIAYGKQGERVKQERALNKIGDVNKLTTAQQTVFYAVVPDKEKALELLLIAIENGDIDSVDLDDWPAFDDLRKTSEFQEIRAKYFDSLGNYACLGQDNET